MKLGHHPHLIPQQAGCAVDEVAHEEPGDGFAADAPRDPTHMASQHLRLCKPILLRNPEGADLSDRLDVELHVASGIAPAIAIYRKLETEMVTGISNGVAVVLDLQRLQNGRFTGIVEKRALGIEFIGDLVDPEVQRRTFLPAVHATHQLEHPAGFAGAHDEGADEHQAEAGHRHMAHAKALGRRLFEIALISQHAGYSLRLTGTAASPEGLVARSASFNQSFGILQFLSRGP